MYGHLDFGGRGKNAVVKQRYHGAAFFATDAIQFLYCGYHRLIRQIRIYPKLKNKWMSSFFNWYFWMCIKGFVGYLKGECENIDGSVNLILARFPPMLFSIFEYSPREKSRLKYHHPKLIRVHPGLNHTLMSCLFSSSAGSRSVA